MVGKFKRGKPRIQFKNHVPRLFLHEKYEKLVRWILRGLTLIGVLTSVITLSWYYALLLSVLLLLINVFLERTLFYYTSLYIQGMPDFEYESKKWTANVFISAGPPEDPNSGRMVGLGFSDKEYARKFFELLRSWNHGDSDNKEENIRLSFITDEDMYYVFLYPSFEKASIKKAHKEIENKNALEKYGKEHFGIVMAMIICKGFSTTNGYALGTFIDNHPVGNPFLLAPFLFDNKKAPRPISEIEAIRMYRYKAKILSELTESDFEYQHWHMKIQPKRHGS